MQALQRLNESVVLLHSHIDAPLYLQIRDSVIQRFEFSVDLFWKCFKDHLEIQHGLKIASPKSVFREACTQNIITKEQLDLLLTMIDDRNNTSYRYDEIMAEQVAHIAPSYQQLMVAIAAKFVS